MPTPAELEEKFWKALTSDRTMMLGIEGSDDGHTRPMTAQIEGDASGPIWFFTAIDNSLVRNAGVKMLLGVDPQKSYRDNVAQVDLH